MSNPTYWTPFVHTVGTQLTGPAAHSGFLSKPLIRGWWKDHSSGLWRQAASEGETVTKKKKFLCTCKPCTVAIKPLRDKHETLLQSLSAKSSAFRNCYQSFVDWSDVKFQRWEGLNWRWQQILCPLVQLLFPASAFTGQNWALCWSWHLGLAEAGGSHCSTQTLHCPRRREDLVPLPKGRSKPALARAAHICCWISPECCKGGLKLPEPERPLSRLWKGNRHCHRNGQVWKRCPSQVPEKRLRLLWQHSFYLWITVIWNHWFSASWNSGPNANM